MPGLPVVALLPLIVLHAPAVAPETMLAFIEAESGGDPLALHDNTTGRSHSSDDPAEAARTARALLARGHSLDAGLAQINSANFAATGLTPETAFDPAASIRARAQILVENYRRCVRAGEEGEDALRCMASRYNTGNPTRGIANGYVARVWEASEHIVPAIRSAIPPPPPPAVAPTPPTPLPPLPDPPAVTVLPAEPPPWDIWGRRDWQEGRAVLTLPVPAETSPPAPAEPTAPADAPFTPTRRIDHADFL